MKGPNPCSGGRWGGLAIADRLARASPGNAGWQRDLALSFAKLAEVNRGSNDLNKAMQALRQGKAIVERLTKLSPGNAGWQRDLTWFDNQITQLQASAKN
jgi:hypothetical protein